MDQLWWRTYNQMKIFNALTSAFQWTMYTLFFPWSSSLRGRQTSWSGKSNTEGVWSLQILSWPLFANYRIHTCICPQSQVCLPSSSWSDTLLRWIHKTDSEPWRGCRSQTCRDISDMRLWSSGCLESNQRGRVTYHWRGCQWWKDGRNSNESWSLGTT